MTAARKLVTATLIMVALVAPAIAHGAQYTVHACGDGSNNSFFGDASDNRMAARSLCAADADGHRLGVAVLAGVSQGTVPVFANATQSFLAPPGTTIARVHLKGDARTSNGDWAALLQASTDRFSSTFWTVAGCLPRAGDAAGCNAATPSVAQTYDLPGATGFRSVVACGNFAGCGTLATSTWPFSRAYYLMHQVDVTLEDNSAPAVTVIGGGLADTGWVRGSQNLIYEAGDNSGVSRTTFAIDDTTFDHFERVCDYTFRVPCGNLNDAAYAFATARISDGPHQITVAAYDATDVNRGVATRTVLIDNHAPAEPAHPAVDGGEGWHTTDEFGVQWANPPSASPVTRALYEICRAGGAGCVSGEQTGDDISRLAGLHVGQPGDYTIRIWLADAAGNVSDAKSSPLHLKFDNVPPGGAAPQQRSEWVDEDGAKRFDERVDPGSTPVSGIDGYAVTTDGTDPGATAGVRATAEDGYAAHAVLTELAEGAVTVKARAISGAGIPSPVIGSTVLHVDRTAPQLTADWSPGEERWSRTPVSVRITGTDPGELSGMASAAPRPSTSGGYIETRIDQGERRKAWGPPQAPDSDGRLPRVPTASDDVVVADDGVHRLAYGGADAAGNTASEHTLTVKVDRTPPELAVFEDQRASDPRLIEVAASDRMSGLADDAEIRVRRISPAQGPWITLASARRGDSYYAHVDNATLVAGDYEFAATIPDQAGNQAVANTDRNGRAKIVYISPTRVGPFPTPPEGDEPPRSEGPAEPDAQATVDTRMSAVAVERTVVRKKCKAAARKRRRCPRPTVRELLVHDLRLPFGKSGLVRGRLTTAAGLAIAHAEITVLTRPAMAGGVYQATAVATTSGDGRFTYKVSALSSRTLDFHFRGDKKYRHADEQVTFRVAASATIKASRHTVRNGKSIRFSGRLRGRPYPAKGKVLDLQAFYRRRWRTFATVRASRSGKWRFKYRFGATRGVVVYKFRVRVRATSDYPYELGYSKTTKVRVRG